MILGIIAESPSDIAVMKVLTTKIIGIRRFGFKHFASYGSPKLRRKCKAWAADLVQRGCSCLVVVHDLDGGDEARLRAELEDRVRGIGCRAAIIVIPVQEIEAWLIADADAIRVVFRLRKQPSLPADPERIAKPKEFLRDL